ncbi:erythromycin esterase family protein [Amycolatopsis sp. NPDC059021]|uniref:erythromycin esterase family protein n=1 Tax=Amycolatopsis sp. NPDC059021 TaxID=3346704 RepID=UPI003672F386
MPGNAVDPEGVTAWLTENAVPLTGVTAGTGHEDLSPIGEVLRGARIVALGEATHGSREFFTLKHRMIEFLVTRLGFRVFAIEAGCSGCRAVDDYIRDGSGDPAAALRALGYWTWNTAEILDLIEWFREYNARVPDAEKVSFRGVDPAVEPTAAEAVARYLEPIEPERAARLREALTLLEPRSSASGLRSLATALVLGGIRRVVGLGRKEKARAEAAASAGETVRETYEFVVRDEDRLVRATSAEAWADAVEHLWALDKGVEIALQSPLGSGGNASRERSMAQAVARVLDKETTRARMILWAHNGHVARKADGWQPLGGHLAEQYGESYYATALVFNEGSFQALKATGNGYTAPLEFEVAEAPAGTVEHQLAQPDLGTYFLDVRGAREDERVARWVTEPSRMRSFGSIVGFWPMVKHTTIEVTLADEYDGLLMVPRTTRATPLP